MLLQKKMIHHSFEKLRKFIVETSGNKEFSLTRGRSIEEDDYSIFTNAAEVSSSATLIAEMKEISNNQEELFSKHVFKNKKLFGYKIVGKVHTKQYKPFWIKEDGALIILVEDKNGKDHFRVCLRNCFIDTEAFSDPFPISFASYEIILYEPYLSKCHFDQEFMFYIESLSQIQITTIIDPKVVLVDELREQGNQFMKKKLYLAAYQSYSLAIIQDPSNPIAYTNRAESCIQLRRYRDAIHDAKKAIQLDSNHPTTLKSYHRIARSNGFLGRFDEAIVFIKKALSISANNQELENDLHTYEQYKEMSENGNYPWKDILFSKIPKRLADYVGPVKLGISGKSNRRGLFTSRDVKAGELLLVANPMAYSGEKISDKRFGLQCAWPMSSSDFQGMLALLVVESSKSPSFFQSLQLLDYSKSPSIPGELLDEEGLKKIIIPLLDAEDERKDEILLDVNEIKGIIETNVFGNQGELHGIESNALYFIPSLMNHSCVPSTTRLWYNDVAIFRANSDLPLNTELTHRYFDPRGDNGRILLVKNRHEISQGWGFECECELCSLELKLGSAIPQLQMKIDPKIDLIKRKLSSSSSSLERKDCFLEMSKLELFLKTFLSKLCNTDREMQLLRYVFLHVYNGKRVMAEMASLVDEAIQAQDDILKILEISEPGEIDLCITYTNYMLFAKNTPALRKRYEELMSKNEKVHDNRYGLAELAMEQTIKHCLSQKKKNNNVDVGGDWWYYWHF